MGANLNNLTAPDAYTTASTLYCPRTARVRLLVNNQMIYWSRGRQPPGGGGVFWENEEPLLPGLYSFDENCDQVRIRAFLPLAKILAPKKQAQVTITTRTENEL